MRMTICKPNSSLTALRRDQPSQLLDFRFVASAQAHECLLSLLSVDVSGGSPSPLSLASLPPNSLLYHRKFTSKLYFFHLKNLSSPLRLQLCKACPFPVQRENITLLESRVNREAVGRAIFQGGR